jgi:protein tyrosine phosphatase (PTP) superfamily phosphohydrolase (DUF442 family)
MARVINGQEYQNPLEEELFMAKLVGLEEAFYKGKTTPDVVGELCLLYADLVQYYDFKKDVIANYFLERIHIVSCAQLYTRSHFASKSNDAGLGKPSIAQQAKLQMPLEELIDLEQKTLKRIIENKPSMEEENQRICDNIPLKIVEMSDQMKIIDATIANNLQSQVERIKEKLEERKRNSFARSSTLSNTSICINGTDSKENTVMYAHSAMVSGLEKSKAEWIPKYRESMEPGILKPLDNILDGLNQPATLRDRMFSR